MRWCPSTAVMDKAHFQFIVPPRANTLWYEGAKPWIGKPYTVLTVTVAGMGSPLLSRVWEALCARVFGQKWYEPWAAAGMVSSVRSEYCLELWDSVLRPRCRSSNF